MLRHLMPYSNQNNLCPQRNAVEYFVSLMPRAALLTAISRLNTSMRIESTDALIEAFSLNLAGFLNAMTKDLLLILVQACQLPSEGSVEDLRARLWKHGACIERGNCSADQPLPIVLGGKLIHLWEGTGSFPAVSQWPRTIPSEQPIPSKIQEPEHLEDLLHNANQLLGIRLGGATQDKGAFGSRVAHYLGVIEEGYSESDWRGEIEIKTLPVIIDRSGWWRVKEDPAISMQHWSPWRKLQKILWVARVADRDDSPILSWYYQECTEDIRFFLKQALHLRPKGDAGAETKGWYIRKNFFIKSGFLKSLNG